jgi:DNA-binding response OmpR family regulator
VKKILAFEADQSLAEELRTGFARYGAVVDVVDDGNVGLQKARTNRPDLILLTIELPKMNGFSICNKLKKNPELKDIPLIILSSEATEDTFQQHRKLRTHAEEYLRKPFVFNELLERVTALVPLEGGPVGVPTQPPPAEPAMVDDDDLAVDTSGLELMVDDDVAAPPSPTNGRAASNGPLSDDGDVEAFTESAFAALQMDEEVPDLDSADGSTPAPFDNDDRTVAIDRPAGFFDEAAQVKQATSPPRPAPPARGSAAGPGPQPPPSRGAGSGAVRVPPPPSASAAPPPAPVAEPPASPPAPAPAPPAAVDDAAQEAAAAVTDRLRSENAALKQELGELRVRGDRAESSARSLETDLQAARTECDALRGDGEKARTLKRENDELKDKVSLLNERLKKVEQGGAHAGAVSSREFLDLRELLNKKDREILDFKDQVNAKEKALLDQRERITALERGIADSNDKILAVEREREELRESLQITTDDKSLLAGKVEGLERRLESSRGENERLKKDLGDERRKREDEQKDAAEQRKKLGEEAEARRKRELEALDRQLASERAAALEALRTELGGAHAKEKAELGEQHQRELQDAEARKEQALTEQRLRHEEELRAREEQLGAERARKVAELEAAHREELAAAARRQAEELQRLGAERDAERDRLLAEHVEATRQHQAEAAGLGARIAELEGSLGQGHLRIEKLEADLRERQVKLGEADAELDRRRQKIEELDATLRGVRQDLQRVEGERDGVSAQLAETQGQLSAALGWNAHNEERVERALEKLRSDGEAIEKTKRAMAIALTLLADLPPHQDPGPPRQA